MELDWNQAYYLYGTEVYRFLLFYTGSRQDAEDITQDTFIRVFRKVQTYDAEDGSRLKALLITAARNLAVDRFRQGNTRRRLNQTLQQQWTGITFDEDSLMQDEAATELHRAIQTLQPNYRAVVILRGIEEHSLSETAGMLNWSESKVKVTYHRALKSLRSRLQAQPTGRNGDE